MIMRVASVSVVFPTKNRPQDVAAAVESVLAQTVLPCQIIVVDQSSTEESRRGLMARIQLLPLDIRSAVEYIHLFDPIVRGLTEARNRSLPLVTGEFVLFLDDDVVLEPEFIERILEVYRDHAEATGVSGIVTNYSAPPASLLYWTHIFMRGPFWDDRQPVYWKASRLRDGDPVRVSRLGGGLMSFRRLAIQGMAFDENLRGACDGEDVDFCCHLQPGSVLMITPRARLIHKMSPAGRASQHWLARHTRTMRYLYQRNWERGAFNRICFAWLNVGYVLAATLGSVRHLSLDSWRAVMAGIREASEIRASQTGSPSFSD